MTPEALAGAMPPGLGAGFSLGQQPPGMPPMLNLDAAAPEEKPDPLEVLQGAIHAVRDAMEALEDPQDTQDAAKAILQLATIQTRLMSRAAPQG